MPKQNSVSRWTLRRNMLRAVDEHLENIFSSSRSNGNTVPNNNTFHSSGCPGAGSNRKLPETVAGHVCAQHVPHPRLKVFKGTKMFLVVQFIDERNQPIEVVAEAWCDEERRVAKWPPHRSKQQYKQLLKSASIPNETWFQYTIKVLYTSGELKKAEKFCEQYAVDSDVVMIEPDSGMPKKRRRTQTTRYTPECDDNSDSDVAESRTSAGAFMPKIQHCQGPVPIIPAVQSPILSPACRSTPVEHAPIHAQNMGQQKILTALEAILREQRQINMKLSNIETTLENLSYNGSSEHVATAEPLPQDMNFPATSLEELRHNNGRLANPAVYKSVLCNAIRAGGRNLPDCISRVMGRFILSHEIVKYVSRTGKGRVADGASKQSLDKLRNLKKLIIDCVHKNLQNCTDQEVDVAVGNWLRNWKDRCGGRNDRRSRSANQSRHNNF